MYSVTTKELRDHFDGEFHINIQLDILPHKVKMQYLQFWSYAEFFLLSWKIPEVMIGVGYTGVKNHFFVILFLQQFFFVFHLLYLNMKWQNFQPGV